MEIATRMSPMVAVLAGSLMLTGCHSARSPLGLRDGRLAGCPATFNCVSSLATDEAHRVAPLPLSGPAAPAIERLAALVRSLPQTTVVTATDTYLHAEFRSAVFRFVDDVEFHADEAAGVIQVRSGSRIGHSDLGVNRRRIEAIRARWGEATPR